MTDLKQLERDTQNIHGSKEHGSYCECISCLEGHTQFVETSDLAEREIEQEMTAMLKDLPLSIAISRQGDLYSDEYTWQCMTAFLCAPIAPIEKPVRKVTGGDANANPEQADLGNARKAQPCPQHRLTLFQFFFYLVCAHRNSSFWWYYY